MTENDDINLYFIQIVSKQKKTWVQQVDKTVFHWIANLPVMDNSVNEPNLLLLDQYPDEGLMQPSNEINAFYAGVVKLPDGKLTVQYHYFVSVRKTALQGLKKKPYRVAVLKPGQPKNNS